MKAASASFFVLSGAFFAPAVLAAPVDTTDLARILLHNRVMDLKDFPKCNDRLTDSNKLDLGDGTVQYKLTFAPSGMCASVNAVVTIFEDPRPRMYDGAPEYSANVEVTPRTNR